MTKNIKFIAPLALVAFGTLASCGGSGAKKASDVFPHLKRVEYTPIKISEYDAKIRRIVQKQYSSGVMEHAMVFDKGTSKLNYAVSLSGDVSYFGEGMMPIDVNGISLAEQNTITFAWSKTDNYIKMTSKDDTGYIVRSTTDNKWYRCFDLGKGGKYKTDISHMYAKYGSIDNFIIGEHKAANGFYITKTPNAFFGRKSISPAASLGMTGFAYTPYWFGSQGDPDYVRQYNMHELPEVFSSATLTTVETALGLVSSLFESKTVAVASKDEDTLSTNIAVKNLDFGKLEDKWTEVLEALVKAEVISETVAEKYKWPVGLSAAGIANLDYFFAYFDDFIKQHEFILDLDDIDVTYDNTASEEAIYNPMYAHVKADASIYVGQEITKDECQIDKVNLEDYTTFNF